MTRNRDIAADCFVKQVPYHNNGSVFTDGTTIWSYGTHFPMAIRLMSDDGRKNPWVNEEKYSATTSQHQGALKRALAAAGYTPTDETKEMLTGSGHRYTYRRWQ